MGTGAQESLFSGGNGLTGNDFLETLIEPSEPTTTRQMYGFDRGPSRRLNLAKSIGGLCQHATMIAHLAPNF